MFQSCLICTDFTDGLYRFVDFVPDLAQCGLQKLVFFHSVPVWEEGEIPRIDEEKVEQAKQRLHKALEQVPPQLDVQVEVLSGKPLDTIPRVLKKHPVDVIMTGTPIRSLLKEKFVGSTSAGLGKLTSQPLNIIRPELLTTYTKEELALRCQHLWRYLLIPYNDSPTARYLIEEIKKYGEITLASTFGGNLQQRDSSRRGNHLLRRRFANAESRAQTTPTQNSPQNSLKQCILISVIDDSGKKSILAAERSKEAQAKLESVKQELEALNIEVKTLVKIGNPLQEIATVALDLDISAIALATDYNSNLLQWAVRSFANDLMRSSWFPILLFSPKK